MNRVTRPQNRRFAPLRQGVTGYLALAVVLLIPPVTGAAASAIEGAETGICSEHQVPVSVPALPRTYEIAGLLCLPPGPPPATVQVLIPGATYDASYWDFAVSGYSYQAYAQARGQATFAISRFNTGASARLPSALVTVQADAAALHQVITALTSGQIGGTAFTRVVTVGHSLGSIIATDEAAAWHDEAAVALTAFTHTLDPAFAVALAAGQILVPALLDPRLAGQPAGDLTTPPGTRATWFYAFGDANPAVIAQDEATKTVITAGELATFPVPMVLPETSAITVPVLQAAGQHDAVFWCGLLASCASSAALRAAEAPYFGGSPSYTGYVLPGSGHDINLAVNHDQFFATLSSWVQVHAG